MFDWFKKKKEPADLPFTDRVWIDEEARLRAIVREACAGPVLLVTFFEASAEGLAKLLTLAGIPFERMGREPKHWGDAPVLLARADQLRFLVGSMPPGARAVVYEHHPLPVEGRALREALATRIDTPPVFHSALDEPLMRRFGGERTAAMMEKLGLTADEPVEHPMVTSAMANMRAKVAAKVRVQREAASMEEWLAHHLD